MLAKRLKELEKANSRLKKPVANRLLDMEILTEDASLASGQADLVIGFVKLYGGKTFAARNEYRVSEAAGIPGRLH